MEEYYELLNKYRSEEFLLYTLTIPKERWGDDQMAVAYMEKYWLSEKEFEADVLPRMRKIFLNSDKIYPEVTFTEGYKTFSTEGGRLLTEKDFNKLQEIMLNPSDNYFYIIENNLNGTLTDPAFRMKFPTNITWDELMSGNYISSALFEMFYNEYFLLGDGTWWGCYSTNEYFPPVHLYGIKNQ